MLATPCCHADQANLLTGCGQRYAAADQHHNLEHHANLRVLSRLYAPRLVFRYRSALLEPGLPAAPPSPCLCIGSLCFFLDHGSILLSCCTAIGYLLRLLSFAMARLLSSAIVRYRPSFFYSHWLSAAPAVFCYHPTLLQPRVRDRGISFVAPTPWRRASAIVHCAIIRYFSTLL